MIERRVHDPLTIVTSGLRNPLRGVDLRQGCQTVRAIIHTEFLYEKTEVVFHES